jgi:hypothetical protein
MKAFLFPAFSQKIFLLVKVKGTLQTGHFLDIDHFKNVSFSSALFFPALYFFHPHSEDAIGTYSCRFLFFTVQYSMMYQGNIKRGSYSKTAKDN